MKLQIKNFRSIKEQEVDLAPITLVYGANGAGKSSLLYTLLTLKNLILNPNQNPSGFFNYTFASLGSFEAVVFDHNKGSDIELGASFEKEGIILMYKAAIGENKGNFTLFIEDKARFKAKLQLPVSFPYPANQQTQETISHNNRSFVITWNGITAQVQSGVQDQEAQEEAGRLAVSLNAPIELLRKVGVVPLKRGFSKPYYSSVPVTPMMITEDEVAAILSSDKYLEQRVSFYLEQILERDFRVHFTPGTGLFSLDSTDKKTGLGSELVNDGFGANQIVYFLARCLHRDTEWVCIEEPEIHLHPSAVRGVAKVLVKIIRDEGKHFLISTHSESFLSALLTLVAKGELKPSDVACYFARKEKKATQFERQLVNEKGQIEGGLTSFIEAELEDIRTFMKANK
ncbi:MAG: AAA family ATPase [Thermodesulfobacteriota bacterium]|nr:AAA family ATPase [Thermodesulfobacteriota bacterium]